MALERQVADTAKNTEAVFDFGLYGSGWVQESRSSSLGMGGVVTKIRT